MKILISGGSGFIGKNLINHLVEKNKDMMLVGRNLDFISNSNIKKIFIDLNNPNFNYEEIINYNPDVFLHLAWEGLPDHSEEISNHVALIAKNKKIREIVNQLQMKIIRTNNRICVEGRDIASKILSKDPKYDVAFYFKCSLDVAAHRRWLDLKKSIPLKEVKKSLKIRTFIDKSRKNSPLIRVQDSILIRSDKLNKKKVLDRISKAIDKTLKN